MKFEKRKSVEYSIQQNEYEHVICKMVAILFTPDCFKDICFNGHVGDCGGGVQYD